LFHKAEDHSFFVASALAEHQQRRGWDDRQLCEYLGCTLEALPRLGLCRRPSHAEPDFADRVRRIAEYAPCDAEALLNLLRESSILAAWRGSKAEQGSTMFLAARDRREASHPSTDETQEPPS
jgi:hypothetical protein